MLWTNSPVYFFLDNVWGHATALSQPMCLELTVSFYPQMEINYTDLELIYPRVRFTTIKRAQASLQVTSDRP